MWGIERNKDPELPMKQRNTSWFVILDDRKHGRAGKFPVFYDIDTGDYLEPPEGFLDSPYETLREWYAVHPQDDPNSTEYKEPKGDSVVPLSDENQDKSGSDLTEDDIPQIDEEFLAAQQVAEEAEAEKITLPVAEAIAKGDEGDDVSVEGDTPEERRDSLTAILAEQSAGMSAMPDLPEVPEDDDTDWDDQAPF